MLLKRDVHRKVLVYRSCPIHVLYGGSPSGSGVAQEARFLMADQGADRILQLHSLACRVVGILQLDPLLRVPRLIFGTEAQLRGIKTP